MNKPNFEQEANDYAEKVSFQVPYDGSNEFYEKARLKSSKIDFIAGANHGYGKAMVVNEKLLEFIKELVDNRDLERYELDEIGEMVWHQTARSRKAKDLIQKYLST